MVFPPRNQRPPHYFGVPGIGGCSRGEKRRRTLRRLPAGNSYQLEVFDGKRVEQIAAGSCLPPHRCVVVNLYGRLRPYPEVLELVKVAGQARRQPCRCRLAARVVRAAAFCFFPKAAALPPRSGRQRFLSLLKQGRARVWTARAQLGGLLMSW